MVLDYRGLSPTEDSSDPNVGNLIMSTTTCQRIMDDFPSTKVKSLNLLQGGWTGPDGGFEGVSNYLTQPSLTSILNGTSNNPCIQRPAVATRVTSYVSNSQVGVAGGVAGLDSGLKVPLTQLPSMGSGYLIGPFGCNSVSQQASATTISNGPKKLAEWAIQSSGGTNFQPMVFMQANAKTSSNLGRTVIEVRMSNGPVSTYRYSDPLVATGTGRSFYTGIQPITVLPCGSANGLSNTSYTPNYNIYLSAWVYDSGIGTSTVNGTDIVVATAFLMLA